MRKTIVNQPEESSRQTYARVRLSP